MKKEYELICKSVLINKSKDEIDEIDEILKSKIDWAEVAGQIVNHRLGGYFYRGLTEEQRKKMPKELNKLLKLLRRAQRDELAEKLDEFKKISNALDEKGIRYCALKGLYFCADFYDIEDRRSNDVDIMVLEEDLSKLDDLLTSFGYVQSYVPDNKIVEASKKEKLIQRLNYHDLVPYVKQLKNFIMEIDINFKFDTVHHVIDNEIFDYGIKRYSRNGYEVNGLPFYTNLLFLCIHFFREGTSTIWTDGRRDVALYKVFDIINCIRVHYDEFNVEEWVGMVKKFELEKKCYYTFNVLNQFSLDKKISKVLELIKIKDLSYLDEIKVEGTDKVIKRKDSFFDSAFDWTK